MDNTVYFRFYICSDFEYLKVWKSSLETILNLCRKIKESVKTLKNYVVENTGEVFFGVHHLGKKALH